MKHTAFGHSITFISQDWEEHPEFTHRENPQTGLFVGDYNSDSDISEDTRLHIDKNTWEDWGLVPDSRPTLSSPSPKTNTVDNNSINGVLDLTFKRMRYPLFGNREGSFTFIYNPLFQTVNGKSKPWLVLYTELHNFLHGRRLRMVLEDDPEFYYEGTFKIENWTSNNDGTGSTVTIGYSVEPYKMSILSSLNNWLWDPFNFYDGVIMQDSFTINVTTNGNKIRSKETYYDLVHPDPNDLPSPDWCGKTGANSKLDLLGLMGTKPQIPIIHWNPTNYSEGSGQNAKNRSVIVNFVSFGYGIHYGKSGIRYKYLDPLGSYGQGTSISSKGIIRLSDVRDDDGFFQFKDMDMIFADNYVGEYQFIQFIGNGTIKIEFHRGSL